MFPRAHLKRLTTNVTLGLVSGIETVVVCLSYASLLFSGLFSGQFLFGASMLLISSVMVLCLHTLMSAFPTVAISPQKQPLAIMTVIAGSLSQMNLGDQLFPTLWTIIAVSTLVTALSATLMGQFRLGNLIRYIPFPVTAGFSTGASWIVIVATLSMLIQQPLHLNNALLLLTPHMMILWGPALLLACLLFGIKNYYTPKSLMVPLVLLLGIMVFYLGMWIKSVPYQSMLDHGLLLGPFGADHIWSPPDINLIKKTHWGAVFAHMNEIAVIPLISLLDCLLNVSNNELATKRHININKELKIFGLSNACSGGIGGFLGALVSNTAAFESEGGNSRIIGFVAAGFCLLILLAGTAFVSWIPRYVFAAVPIYFGMTTLIKNLSDGWRKLPTLEFLTLISILWVIGFFGVVNGVVLGIILSIMLFVLNYSRVNVIRHALTGHTLKSSLQRTPMAENILMHQGHQIYYLKLHGYLFFGTGNRLFEYMVDQLKKTPSLRYLILDFTLVDGLDSSASIYLAKLNQMAQSHPFHLICTQMHDAIKKSIHDALNESPNPSFESLDQALEWCEDHILRHYPTPSNTPRPLVKRFEDLIHHKAHAELLLQYFKRKTVLKDTVIVRQGDPSDALYFIESGLVSIFITNEEQQPIRLRKVGPNNIIGEMGLYTHDPRSASIIADKDSVLHELSLTALATLESEHPDLATSFHKLVIQILIERLNFRNQQVKALMQ